MGCRTARYTPWWHKEDLWILTCWRFKAESPGTDAWVALSGALHMHRCTAERRQHKPTWGWIHPRELTQNASWDALPLKGMAGQTYVLTHLEMPAILLPHFWSLTLKFRNSRELGRIQQPVCQLTGTKDVTSKLLPSVHVPRPRGNTNTLEACEFKLTLWHGLQNAWSY